MKSLIPLSIFAFSLCTVAARAAVITIPHGNFDSPDASAGYTSGSLTGFNESDNDGGGYGTEAEPVTGQFSEATPHTGYSSETQVAYSNPNGAAGAYQDFVSSASVANVNTSLDYTLSIYVGNRADYSSTTGTYTVDLYVGGVTYSTPLVVTDTTTVGGMVVPGTVPAGTYAQLTLNYIPLATQANDPITVGFTYTQGASSHQGIFADFTLNTAPLVETPEPSSFALFFCGLGALALVSRLRRTA